MLSLGEVARSDPRTTALIEGTRVLSFAKLFDKSESLARELRLDGAERTPVAFVAHNDAATIALIHALLERHIPLLPVNPRLTANEQERLSSLAGARRLDRSGEGFSWQDTSGNDRVTDVSRERARCQLLLATSGSSGLPKLVRLTLPAIHAAASASVSHLGMTTRDRWLLSLGLAHVGGISILFRCLLAHAAVVLAEPGVSAPEMARLIETAGATLASFVPAQLDRLASLDSPPALSSLRAVLLGGAGATPQLRRRAKALRWPVLLTYGMSEAGSHVTMQPLSDLDRDEIPADAGHALTGIEVKLDEDIICVRGATMFEGYLGELGSPIDADGWFRTGDFGRLTEQGRLVPLGRRDDCIVTGGEKVAPVEIETAIMDHGDFRAAAVVGLPDPRWGQIVAAAVIPDGPSEFEHSLKKLEATLATELAPYKRPRRWLSLEELPHTANGKLDRQALRALFLR